MKARPDCIACMFAQALNTAREVTADERIHGAVLQRLAERVARLDLANTPAFVSQEVYRVVAEVTGEADPFARHKRDSNALALRILPRVRAAVQTAEDPLAAAVHLAATGNSIDAGIAHNAGADVEDEILRMLDHPFGRFDLDAFRSELGPGKQLLYLGDNAGEIVFDTVLVDLIRATGTAVTYSVKSGPIINDATRADAATAGMDDRATVIETGSDDIGVNFARVSETFRSAFGNADVILAKGHGNFETCNDRPENLYFLLKAKCRLVAAELGVPLGNLVFMKGRRSGIGPIPAATLRPAEESLPRGCAAG
jgi:damage-control phosphatase, subfamily I